MEIKNTSIYPICTDNPSTTWECRPWKGIFYQQDIAWETLKEHSWRYCIIIHKGGCLNFEISNGMTSKCNSSRSSYQKYLDNKQEEKEQEKQRNIEVSFKIPICPDFLICPSFFDILDMPQFSLIFVVWPKCVLIFDYCVSNLEIIVNKYF